MKARTFARLTAKLARDDGTVTECEQQVSWQSSNRTSLPVASDGTLQAQDVPGEAEITARCGDRTASVRAAVGRTLVIEAWAHESDPVVPGGFGDAFWIPVPSAVAEVLDGPDAGSTFLPSAGTDPFLLVPVRLRASAGGYVTSEFEIAPEPGHSGNSLRVQLPLRPLPPPPGTIERKGVLARGSPVTHEFEATRGGLLAVRTWWSLEYSTRLNLELRCRGELVKTATQTAQSFGQGFDVNVPSGPCSLSVLLPGGNYLVYRVRVTLP